jgi:hypothetical protein
MRKNFSDMSNIIHIILVGVVVDESNPPHYNLNPIFYVDIDMVILSFSLFPFGSFRRRCVFRALLYAAFLWDYYYIILLLYSILYIIYYIWKVTMCLRCEPPRKKKYHKCIEFDGHTIRIAIWLYADNDSVEGKRGIIVITTSCCCWCAVHAVEFILGPIIRIVLMFELYFRTIFWYYEI